MQNPDALPRDPSPRKTPARYWVATFSDMGLEVYHYADPLTYGRAIQTAKRQHDAGEVDSYTYGDATTGH